jgi:hypothetical protein
MAFHYSPKIVTDGLVLYLDAANTKSYVSTSTSWNDISRGGNNGTLVNGPTFNSANGGSIVFDGVDDYVSIPNNNNLIFGNGNFTVSIWIKTPISSTGEGTPSQWGPIVSKGCTTSAPSGTWWFAQNSTLSNRITFNISSNPGGTFVTAATTPILSNGWHNIVFTRTGSTGTLYTDGTLTNTDTSSDSDLSSSAPVWVAGTSPSATKRTSMTLSQTSIYNRTLSAAEVLQNYNATKSRFGLL